MSVTSAGFYELVYFGAVLLNVIANVLQLKYTLDHVDLLYVDAADVVVLLCRFLWRWPKDRNMFETDYG